LNQKLHTQVTWTVEFISRDKAIHHITIDIFFLDCAVPSIHDSIRLELPDTNFRDFTTLVENNPLPPNYGLDAENMLYCLKTHDIRNHVKKGQSPVSVKITFQQTMMVRKIFGADFIDFGFKSRFADPVSTELLFRLPRIASRIKRGISTLIGWFKGRNRRPYEIVTFDRESVYDETEGTIGLLSKNLFPDFGFAYKVVGAINLSSLVTSIILAIILSALGNLLFHVLSR
jgi:hypothetical protein